MGNINPLSGGARGQAFLSTVLLIGGVVVFIGAGIALLAATFVDSGYGLQASNQAEAIATAGVNDAFLRLVRNSSFSSAGYVVTLTGGSAAVVVSSSTPITGETTVLSSATVSGRTRKINAIFGITSSTGQVVLASWQDVQ